MGWAGLAQFTCLAIRLVNNLILARLLAPQIYGVLGTATAVITTLGWFSDLGVQPALIRHPNGMRREFLNTGWWINLSRGLLLMVITAGLGYPLSRAYGQPVLLPVFLVLSLQPALAALRSPGMPRLRRTLNYRALFVDEVTQVLVVVLTSLGLAWAFRSLWAIVFGGLAGTVAGVVISYVLCPLAPIWSWDKTAFQEIAHVSRQIFVNTMAMAAWLNLDRVCGLWFVDEATLGCYFIALNLIVVVQGLVTRGCDVYFSLLSRCTDLDQRARWHHRVSDLVSIRGMPVLAVGIVAAPAVISTLYDPRYAPARILLGIVLARFMFSSLASVQYQYLLSLAEVRLNTRAYLAAVAVQAVCFVPLARTWGVTGIALSSLIAGVVMAGTQSLVLRVRHGSSLAPFWRTLGWASLGLAILVWTQGLAPVVLHSVAGR
jgi:O-antigen/teichoic acid export membrane protein